MEMLENGSRIDDPRIPGKVIFKTVVGSHAYGTNVEGSDIDIKGVYIQDIFDIATFEYKPQVELNKDEVYYEIRRFIELLGSANPTVLELLFMPEDCIIYKHRAFDELMKFRYEFLTKECRNSFGGYARQQIKKADGLDKKMNWEKKDMVRKTPVDFCYVYRINGKRTDEGDDFVGPSSAKPLSAILSDHNIKQEDCGLTALDHVRDGYILWHPQAGIKYAGLVKDDSNALRLSSIPKGTKPWFYLTYNKDGYTQHCNDYNQYQTWLKERNVQRYVDIDTHGQKIDGKNMLHCMRLINTAYDIAATGDLIIRRPEKDFLISIRKGKVILEDILTLSKERIIEMDKYFDESNLPDKISNQRLQEILKYMRILQATEYDFDYVNSLQ